MIDGIKIRCRINDLATWQQAVNMDFFTSVNKETGAVKEKAVNELQTTITHIGAFEYYKLIVKEVHKKSKGKRVVSYYLNIEGSLHKNHFNGANYAPFTLQSLQAEINHLLQSLQLQGEFCKLDNLEIGVNILLPFAVFQFLENNLIAYKGQSFSRYQPDKNGLCLGYRCRLSQYEVKIYDKGRQFDLPFELMRFELRFLKMQKLNHKNINTLTDLMVVEKVNDLLPLLLEAWDNVLLCDDTIDFNNPKFKPEQKELLLNGSNPKFWERLKKQGVRMYNYQKSRFKKLVVQHGSNTHKNIRNLISEEWHNLMNNTSSLPTIEKPELYKFTIKIKGKNVQNRTCLSCGKDISHQHPKSKYCSAKYVGYAEAHKCRNDASNPPNNRRRKIERIKSKGVLFDIEPFLINTPRKRRKTA